MLRARRTITIFVLTAMALSSVLASPRSGTERYAPAPLGVRVERSLGSVVDGKARAAIVGGGASSMAPYFVRIDIGGMGSCGGVLVAREFVLTAAHCMLTHKKLTCIVNGKSRAVLGGRIHERYNPNPPIVKDWAQSSHDICILRIEPSDGQAVPVYVGGIPPGTGVIAMGYGDGNVFKSAAMNTIPDYKCTTAGEMSYADAKRKHGIGDLMCATARTGHTCAGDSGGPVMGFSKRGQVVLMGLTSAGTAGADNIPCKGSTVFVRVGNHLPWILRAVASIRAEKK